MGGVGNAEKSPKLKTAGQEPSRTPAPFAPDIASTPLGQLAQTIRTSPVMQARTAAVNSAFGPTLQPNRTGLPDALKSGVEAASGLSMDDVRVTWDSPKPARLHALAYAQGSEIHLGPGQEQHLPHEAWHVVQQKQGRVKPTLQMKGVAINADAGLELEADRMALGMWSGRHRLAYSQSFAPLADDGVDPPAVVQRIATQITTDPNTQAICEVLIGGRPESPFTAAMGDHTTAFHVQIEAVRARMVGKTSVEALKALRGLYLATLQLPGLALTLDEPESVSETMEEQNQPKKRSHSQMLRDAQERVKQLLRMDDAEMKTGDLETKEAWPSALDLQEIVNAYLEFREYIPLSLLNIGEVTADHGKGHGEAAALEMLREMSKEDISRNKLSKIVLDNSIYKLFEAKGIARTVIEQNKYIFNKIAPGVPQSNFNKDAILQFIDRYAHQHLASIALAFPNFEFNYESVRFISERVFREHVIPLLKKDREEQQHIADTQINQRNLAIDDNHGVRKGSTNIDHERGKALAEMKKRYDTARARVAAIEPLLDRKDFENDPAQPWLVPEETMSRSAPNERTGRGTRSQVPPRTPDEERIADAVKRREKEWNSRESESETKNRKNKRGQNEPEVTPSQVVNALDEAHLNLEESNPGKQLRGTLVIQIVLSADGKIGDLKSEGRPRSPVSVGMGAHFTAWIVELDYIRMKLTEKTIGEAHVELGNIAGEVIDEAEQWLKMGTDERREQALADLITQLKQCAEESAPTAVSVQRYISAVLALTNMMPGAVTDAVSTGGKSEGDARAIVLEPGNKKPEDVKRAIFRLSDASGIENEELKKTNLKKHLAKMKATYLGAWNRSGIEMDNLDQQFRYAEDFVWEKKKEKTNKGRYNYNFDEDYSESKNKNTIARGKNNNNNVDDPRLSDNIDVSMVNTDNASEQKQDFQRRDKLNTVSTVDINAINRNRTRPSPYQKLAPATQKELRRDRLGNEIIPKAAGNNINKNINNNNTTVSVESTNNNNYNNTINVNDEKLNNKDDIRMAINDYPIEQNQNIPQWRTLHTQSDSNINETNNNNSNTNNESDDFNMS